MRMRKKWIVLIVGGVLLAGGLSAAYAAERVPGLSAKPSSVPEIVTSYEDALVRAKSEEQKRKISDLQAADPAGISARSVMMILGELPESQPRLTEQLAQRIVSRVASGNRDEIGWNVIREFNRIHGAPDFTGGSGMHRTVYVLKENPPTSIMVMDNLIVLWKTDKENPDTPVSYDMVKQVERVAPESSSTPRN
ncbi:hypothetical protein [Gorillibacterium timonense]|uniref:hypothetical protein n=1 Tax=Gorillibacterium timonense TaxID=1689269 RepID=UPI00071D4D58|nr:hypothetical protein [Gorillibacterium timonense]